MTDRPMVWTTLFAVVVATCDTGCASTAPPRSALNPDRAGESAGDVITRTELARLDPGLSMMDALERVAPTFLRPHGSVSTVSIDNALATDQSVLRTLRVVDVQEVRLLRGTVRDARATIRPDGAVEIGGNVILVVTRRAPE